ncbi:alpha/beta fold hydrolase [Yinghuangia sp. ASG 101]|uniref:alpha/beta fold hydrolase n=1 Tax=Yinghuangia sp. ASG 101 TaxID=2896848 RepID=UPI001E516A6C|nr:alpha/beta fold hydrolase [Yinghuangia sp. ASG 101]UGQ11999.1 alpha/beta fold hydrolase [Yinghuangia sp. ASG 101]
MTAAQPLAVEFDVGEAIGEPATIAGSYFPHTGPGAAKAVLVCLPGGTYDRGYFDLEVPGHPGYSFARHAAAGGYGVLALDHLGTGAGSRPNRAIDLTDLAAAAASAVAAVPGKLGQDGPFVAVSHSLGGYVALLQQAAHRSYGGLAILGTTNQYVAQRPPSPETAALAETAEGRAALVDRIVAALPDRSGLPDRSRMRSWFHRDDVPEAVVAADDATTLTVVPRRAGAQASVPGTARDAAAAVDVPVFLCYGDVDVSPDPHREPAFFPNSRDVTLYLLRDAAHCHNMAGTRHLLWHRLLHWCDTLTPN